MMENQDKMIYFSITDLAEQCKTSEATIIRVCRKLGYSGFQEMKINVARELVDPIERIHEEIDIEDNSTELIEKIFSSNIKTITMTKSVLDPKEIEKACDSILKSNKIVVIGLGNAGAIALDAAHKFLRLGFNVSGYTDNHLQAIASSVIKEGDVMLGISHSGSSRDIVESMDLARKNKAITICITSYGKSPITFVSDIKLFTASTETKYRTFALSSRIAELSIIDTLYTYLALKKGNEAIANFEGVEKALLSKKY